MTLIDLLQALYPDLTDPQLTLLATLYNNPDGIRVLAPTERTVLTELAALGHCHPHDILMGIARFPGFQIAQDSLLDIAAAIDAASLLTDL